MSVQTSSINFGNPIVIDRKTKLTPETEAAYNQQLEDAWKQIDQELDPDFHYEAK